MPKSNSFKETYGPWALVTGASDGIGAALAKEVASRGVNVVLTARRTEVMEQLGATLRSEYGIETQVVPADLGRPDDIDALLDKIEHREIGLYVGCAGFATAGSFAGNDRESELNMIDVNCRGLVDLCHRTVGAMVVRRRGGVILMSSIVAFQGVENMTNYAATKAFVQTFGEGLQREVAMHGITVVASAPGPVGTGFSDRADIRMGNTANPEDVARGTVRALARGGTVRPGFLAKLLGWNLAMLPRRFRTQILSRIMAGTIAHRNAG